MTWGWLKTVEVALVQWLGPKIIAEAQRRIAEKHERDAGLGNLAPGGGVPQLGGFVVGDYVVAPNPLKPGTEVRGHVTAVLADAGQVVIRGVADGLVYLLEPKVLRLLDRLKTPIR